MLLCLSTFAAVLPDLSAPARSLQRLAGEQPAPADMPAEVLIEDIEVQVEETQVFLHENYAFHLLSREAEDWTRIPIPDGATVSGRIILGKQEIRFGEERLSAGDSGPFLDLGSSSHLLGAIIQVEMDWVEQNGPGFQAFQKRFSFQNPAPTRHIQIVVHDKAELLHIAYAGLSEPNIRRGLWRLEVENLPPFTWLMVAPPEWEQDRYVELAQKTSWENLGSELQLIIEQDRSRLSPLPFQEAGSLEERVTALLQSLPETSLWDKGILVLNSLKAAGIPATLGLTHDPASQPLLAQLPGVRRLEKVVIRVDTGGEPLWLELESRLPYLPWWYGGQPVLMAGTALETMPYWKKEAHFLREELQVFLEQEGESRVEVRLDAAGDPGERYHQLAVELGSDGIHTALLLGGSGIVFEEKQHFPKPMVAYLKVDKSPVGWLGQLKANVHLTAGQLLYSLPAFDLENRLAPILLAPGVRELVVTIPLPSAFVIDSLPHSEKLTLGPAFLERMSSSSATEAQVRYRLEIGHAPIASWDYHLLKRRIEEWSQDQVLLIHPAQAALDKEGFKEALATLNQELEGKERLKTLRRLGLLYSLQNMLWLAEGALKQAVVLAPEDALALRDLGVVRMFSPYGLMWGRGWRRQEALEALQKSYRLNPEDSHTVSMLGQLLARSEQGQLLGPGTDPSQAREILLSTPPDRLSDYAALALITILFQQGMYTELEKLAPKLTQPDLPSDLAEAARIALGQPINTSLPGNALFNILQLLRYQRLYPAALKIYQKFQENTPGYSYFIPHKIEPQALSYSAEGVVLRWIHSISIGHPDRGLLAEGVDVSALEKSSEKWFMQDQLPGVMLDWAGSQTPFPLEGDAAGWRIKNAEEWFFLVGDPPKLFGIGQKSSIFARGALKALETGSVVAAVRWLDWLRETIGSVEGAPIDRHPFLLAWSGSRDAETARTAANVVLAMEGDLAALKALESVSDREGFPIARARFFGGIKAGDAPTVEAALNAMKPGLDGRTLRIFSWQLLKIQKREAQLIEEAQSVVVTDPTNAEAWRFLYEAQAARQDYAAAVASIEAMRGKVKISSGDSNNQLWYALFLEEQPVWLEERLSELGGSDGHNNTRAVVLNRLKKHEEAWELFISYAQEADAIRPAWWLVAGGALKGFGLMEEAEAAYKKAGVEGSLIPLMER